VSATPLLAGPGESGGPRLLVAWALFQGVLGLAAVAFAGLYFAVEPTIALPIPGLAGSAGVAAGVVAWVLFGLVGGMRARPRPGGSVLTFSMPFIVAGTLLGGPFVGGLMGLLSEWEAREVRGTPWYGTIANHGVAGVSAVVAGILALAARPWLDALLPGQSGAVFALTAALTAFVFATLNVALVVPTLAIREHHDLLEASLSYDASFRATSIAEGVLAWLMATTYLTVGWWAPVVSVVLVLAVWQAYDRAEALGHDPMTGLLNDVGFAPRLRAAHEAARAGRRPYALLVLDLDRFKAVNDDPAGGHAAGDEVIRAVARRLNAVVRSTDVVVRFNRAGDEFGVLFPGVGSEAVIEMLSARIRARIAAPIVVRGNGFVAMVGASIGSVIVPAGTTLDEAEVRAEADRRMFAAKPGRPTASRPEPAGRPEPAS
jgi:diguanylate cyclase (GGDEF)-like protein